MLETKLTIIEETIQNGRRMAFMYGGTYREVYPHILMNRNNAWRLCAVRIRYDTSSLPSARPEWQYFRVDHIMGRIVVFEDKQDQV